MIAGDGGVGVACLPQEEESAMPSEDAICYTVGWGENHRPSPGPPRRRGYNFFKPFYLPFGGRFWGSPMRSRRRPDALREIKVSVDPPEKCFHHDDDNEAQICAGNYETVRSFSVAS